MAMPARIPLVLIGALALAACGDDDSPAASSVPADPASSVPATVGGTAPADDLDGRQFVASDVEGHEPVEGSTIRLSFDGENLGASGGCNTLGGTWSLDGDVLVVSAMQMTEMACDQTLMEQDDWLAAFLSSGPTVALAGDTLTLTGADATITFLDREVAEPDRDLEGTTWVLDGLISGDAVSSAPAGIAMPTLSFAAGEVAIDTGCNTGGAMFEAGDGELTIGSITLTRMACSNADASATESAMLAVLEGDSTYAIDANVLTIMHGDAGLMYRAMKAGG